VNADSDWLCFCFVRLPTGMTLDRDELRKRTARDLLKAK
jgi:hypothetical protein